MGFTAQAGIASMIVDGGDNDGFLPAKLPLAISVLIPRSCVPGVQMLG